MQESSSFEKLQKAKGHVRAAQCSRKELPSEAISPGQIFAMNNFFIGHSRHTHKPSA